MTPQAARKAADALIAAANAKNKAKLEAASDRKSAAAKRSNQERKLPARTAAEWNAIALAKPTRQDILLKAGEEQLLGRFALGREKSK